MFLVNVREETIEEVEIIENKEGCGIVFKKGNEIWFHPTEDSNCFFTETKEQAAYNLYIRKYNLLDFVPQ